MVYLKGNVAPLCYYIALLSVTVNPQTRNLEEYSEESSYVSSGSVGEEEHKDPSEDEASMVVPAMGSSGKPSEGDREVAKLITSGRDEQVIISASSSVSDERPIEDYAVKREGQKLSERSYMYSCYKKIVRFCVKACKKTYRDVCYEYRCRSSFRQTFKRGCKSNCKSHYYDYEHTSYIVPSKRAEKKVK